MAYSVQKIAEKIILNTDVEKGDIISNLKLQKLLYYLQGYTLAFFDRPLFEENLEAWQYGPVVPEVYHRFKEFRGAGIELDNESFSVTPLTEEEENVFSQVITEYGKFSAIKLMEMTHKELPWKEAFNADDKTIRSDSMKNFFKQMIDE